MKKIIVVAVLILLVGLGVFLLLNKRHAELAKPLVVTTNFPAYDFARAILQDTAEIKMLIKPGAEIHAYEPTPRDILEIQDSDYFIYNGGESEEWVEKILSSSDLKKTKVIKMTEAVKLVEEKMIAGMEVEDDELDGAGKADIEYDEHVWTSPKNAMQILSFIREQLREDAALQQAALTANTEQYLQELRSLDQRLVAIVKNGQRKELVFGDRFPFRYLVDDYGLTYYAAFAGCSEQSEVSPRTVAFLADKLRAGKAPVVLKLELSNGKIAETLAEETGAEVQELHSAHNVSAADFQTGVTYVDLMKRNLKVLKKAIN